jgi:plasmid maintenance system antidote protein VapI
MLSMAPILDDIRNAIKTSGKSRYRMSKDLGISEGQLSELMAGTKGLSVEAVERLVEYLGLEVVIRPKQQRKGR